MLISDEYRTANARLHDALPYYGSYGGRHAEQVRVLMARKACQTVLDYGAGKGTLALAMPDIPVRNYDPVTFPDEPEPADFVACLDVLEHIEPECFKAVLWHLRSKVLKAGFLTIATRPAQKVLPDGRNAHLIIRPAEWWLPKFQKRFSLVQVLPESSESDLAIYVEA
jgi:2-polyprenyl-3-methyl-5-hydroxy-6-metoxy-1,4-benzoquinol methylase